MIKLIASIYLYDGSTKSCTFQSKENKSVLIKDLDRIRRFAEKSLDNNLSITLRLRITYENNKRKNPMISNISKKAIISHRNKLDSTLYNVIETINKNI